MGPCCQASNCSELLQGSVSSGKPLRTSAGAFTFTKWWGKAAVGCDTALIAGSNDKTELFLLLQLKGTLKISREDFPLCISDYAFKMPWIWTQGSNDERSMLPWLLPSCPSVLAYPVLPNHTEQGQLQYESKRIVPWVLNTVFLYSFGIIWMLNVFS